jgi:Phage P22-like portal protein
MAKKKALKPKEIREAYSDYRSEWQDIRDEAQKDMRYVAGDPWDPEDRQQREDAGRPCISLDEINQYTNQHINNLAETQLAIQATPKGDGANDADALKRSDLIMAIEDRSQAQGVYMTAAENQVWRSYGFAVIRTEYRDNESFDQEILIKPIPNPDTVLFNPNYKQPDGSDVGDAFLLDLVPRKQFKSKYPDAEITDFTGDTMGLPGIADWIKEKYVQVAEYWRIEHEISKLLLVELPAKKKGLIPAQQIIISADKWKIAMDQGAKGLVKRERRIEIPNVVQYLTNGLEILDEVEWAGTRIPICACFGKELWLTEGGQAKRILMSMVRLARDPQMLAAYLATQELEEAGQIPKAPFVGYKGQFESDQEAWEEVHNVPHAYLQVDVIVDGATGEVLPLPIRPQYTANFQQWEMAKDSASRSVQKAMGIAPLPTAALRANQKSGIAIEKVQTEQAIGSMHFTQNFKKFLHNVGWQVNELITPVLDTQREMPVTKPDGTRSTMQLVGNASHPINAQGNYSSEDLPADHLHTGKGEFDVTINDGPSYQSAREKEDAFADKIIEELPTMPIPPAIATKILAKAIKMKDIGAIGDQIATLLDPPDPNNLPPEAQAIITQLQGQLQQAQTENSSLHLERAGKVLEQQTKMILQQMKEDGDNQRARLANDIKVLLAEIAAKSQSEQERQQLYETFWKENHGAAHEVGLQAMEHQHEAQQTAQQIQLAQATAAAQTAPGASGDPGGTSAPG